MKRTSKKVVIGITEMQANDALGRYAKAASREVELTAQMEQKITTIREQFSAQLKLEADIMEENARVIESYAAANPELFQDKKSIELQHGKIGYRTSPPSLKTAKGLTWITVLEKVKKYLPEFVRTKEEVDKAALLTQREEDAIQEAMAKCGIEVKQDETFFIEPKTEE